MGQGKEELQLHICGDIGYCKIQKQTKSKEIVDFWSGHLPCLEVRNETFDFVPF